MFLANTSVSVKFVHFVRTCFPENLFYYVKIVPFHFRIFMKPCRMQSTCCKSFCSGHQMFNVNPRARHSPQSNGNVQKSRMKHPPALPTWVGVRGGGGRGACDKRCWVLHFGFLKISYGFRWFYRLWTHVSSFCLLEFAR